MSNLILVSFCALCLTFASSAYGCPFSTGYSQYTSV
jgi:hypothetical protein